ncbi:hypothetical protein LguiA_014365 [Lonicera macranthoides]
MASSEHSYGIWCKNCLLGELYLFSMIWRDIYALPYNSHNYTKGIHRSTAETNPFADCRHLEGWNSWPRDLRLLHAQGGDRTPDTWLREEEPLPLHHTPWSLRLIQRLRDPLKPSNGGQFEIGKYD